MCNTDMRMSWSMNLSIASAPAATLLRLGAGVALTAIDTLSAHLPARGPCRASAYCTARCASLPVVSLVLRAVRLTRESKRSSLNPHKEDRTGIRTLRIYFFIVWLGRLVQH